MKARAREYRGAVSDELRDLLDGTEPVDEVKKELRREPLDLDSDPEFVAERLKADVVEAILRAMKRKGVNKNQLAERVGKSRQWVSRVLNETNNFTVGTIAQLACALGVKPRITLSAPRKAASRKQTSRKKQVAARAKSLRPVRKRTLV